MHCCTSFRNALLILCLSQSSLVWAQASGDSPYSAYGLGDLLSTGQTTQSLMGGTGLAITEPFAVLSGNPAAYAALARPLFEAGVAFRSTRSTSATAGNTVKDANFTGFNIGVPFGQGKWGLALGLAPYSDVRYKTGSTTDIPGGQVSYSYTGSGGLDRAFFGLGRSILQHRPDSLGNTGSRLLAGADLGFIFGSMEQTRDAVYPANQGYANIRSFTTLVLRAPTANASLIWQGDLTRKKRKEEDNWRWSVGASAHLPVDFRARYSALVTSYVTNSGFETVRDTVPGAKEQKGGLTVPLAWGLGFGVQNSRWAFTVETAQQDWGQTVVDVPGYALPDVLRRTSSYAAAVRFKPSMEGDLFHRAVYRMGLRHTDAPQEVRGQVLATAAASVGVSLPLNAAQTNSWFNFGAELGQRGTTAQGLVKERYVTVWLGLTFTPWRGERWFMAPKIQ